MKILLIVSYLLFTVNAFAKLTSNETCKMCHPKIYKEYKTSAHSKSTIYEDAIHKAIWDMHPRNKKNKYTCAKCHTPSDVRVLKALKEGTSALPKDDELHHEAIACITCHSIQNIKSHPKSHDEIVLADNDKKRPIIFAANKKNRNDKGLYEREHNFFKCKSRSPYHDINYTNELFYAGKMCLGCHKHMENKWGQNICTTDKEGAIDEESNCITCHMPKVEGSFSTAPMSKKHRFHGFAGTRNKPEMLSKYLKIDFKRLEDGFEITLRNEAKHNLLLHPLRVGKLNVTIHNGTKTDKLKSISFVRILGNKGKPSMPWLATEIFKENMLKADENRTIKYDRKLQKTERVEVVFGFYLVNPKMLKKLNLTDNKEASKFNVLKTEFFEVK
jgi:hypothetical protein